MLTASVLILLTGLAHSYLGERYILIRLFRRGNLPELFGDDSFTKSTLRFAWHLTTVAWLGFAFLLLVISQSGSITPATVLNAIGTVSLVSGLISAGFSRGKHLSWIVFFIVAGLCYYRA